MNGRVPVVPAGWPRTVLGAAVLAAAAFAMVPDAWGAASVALVIAWAPAIWLTDKYTHKYPRRYYTYLLASHAKAALVMAVVLGPIAWLSPSDLVAPWPLAQAFLVAVAADLAISVPSRVAAGARQTTQAVGPAVMAEPDPPTQPVNTAALAASLATLVPPEVCAAFSAKADPSATGPVGVALAGHDRAANDAGVVLFESRVNDVRDVDAWLYAGACLVPYGGYAICRYVPMSAVTEHLHRRWGHGVAFKVRFLVHFLLHRAWPKIPRLNAVYFALTGARGRVFSKVEVWGRLAYAGLHVLTEIPVGDEVWIVARRVSPRPPKKRPSYYPVVPLEKVGLDGGVIYLHKIRSMYPYSEFLQKRMFEDHGLSSTGKFANDFRLTEYGPFIRKYWLDELPQWLDWLRGDVKLVGMRATSRHYLSLYPQELIDLYLRTKPGLIPPIFDEATPGFEGIVATELAYLRQYQQAPARTDVRYFFKTFADIFLRGVRSK